MHPVPRPLVLTGGPAVGKSTAGRALASSRRRAAFIDADDVRQLVVAGAATLWSGAEGVAQHALATTNTIAMTRNLIAGGFEVVVADFLTSETTAIYRSLLPEALIIHLAVPRAEARRRATTRPVHLTPDEFELLHDMAGLPPAVDLVLDVGDLTPEQQTAMIRSAWEAATS